MDARSCAAVAALALSNLLAPALAQEAADTGFHPPAYGRKWAVIIGIGQYQGVGFLRNPANDARAVRDLLIEDFGYQRKDILYLSDEAERLRDPSTVPATKEAIRNAFVKWLACRHPTADDSLLVYFAGHGSDDPNRSVGTGNVSAPASGEGYLAALRTKPGDVTSWIKLSELVDWMQGKTIPCRHRLLILDCCYSGQLFQRPEARGSGSTVERVLGRVVNGRVVANGQPDSVFRYYLSRPSFYGISAGRDFAVDDGMGTSSHSPFTSVLLRELRDRADSLRADQAFTFRRDLAPRIERATPTGLVPWQIPDWGRLAEGDGDFLFRPTSRSPTPSDRARTAERIAFARDEIVGIRYDVAARLLDLCPIPTRAWEWNYLKELVRQEGRTVENARSPVVAIAFHPTEPVLASGHEDGTIYIIDTLGGRTIRTLEAPTEPLRALAYSPGGSLVAAAGGIEANNPGQLAVWEADNKEPVRTLGGFRGSPLSLAFSKDGLVLFVGGGYPGPDKRNLGELKIWDTVNWNEVRSIDVAAGPVASISASPNGRWFHTAGPNGGGMWDARKFEEIVPFPSNRPPAAIGPEGNRIATAGDTRVVVLDIKAQKALGSAGRFKRGETGVTDLSDLHAAPITGLAFTPDGSHIATASRDGSARLHDIETGIVIRIIEPGLGPLTALAIRPNGSQFALGSAAGQTRVYDMSRFDGSQRFSTFGTPLDLAVAPDGQRIAVSTHTGALQLRDLNGTAGSVLFRPFKEPTGGLAFVANGTRLVVGNRAGTILLLDAASGRRLCRLAGHKGSLHALVPSSDGKSLVSVGGVAGKTGEVNLWDPATGAILRSFEGHTDEVFGAAFHPEGDRLATVSGGNDRTLRVWAIKSGELLKTISMPAGGSKVEFSPDGRLLAVIPIVLPLEFLPPDGLVGALIWDARTYQSLDMIAGHSLSISGLAFSQDSRRLATSGMDGYVRIWDVSPERQWGEERLWPVLTLRQNDHWIGRLAFTPDNRRLVAATSVGVGQIEVWDAPPSPELGLVPVDGLRGNVSALTFSPDDRSLVEVVTKFGSGPNFQNARCEVIVRDARFWSPVTRLSDSSSRIIMSAALGPGSASLFVAGGKPFTDGGKFKYTDSFFEACPATPGEPRVIARSNDGPLRFAITPRGQRIAVVGKAIRVWDTEAGDFVFSHEKDGVTFGSPALDPSGRRLAVSVPDNSIKLWDLETSQVRTLVGHRFLPSVLVFDPSGRRLASFATSLFAATKETEVKVWSLDEATSTDLKHPPGSSVVLAFTPNGNRLLTIASDAPRPSYLRVWDPGTGGLTHAYRMPSVLFQSLALRNDGKLLVTGDYNGELRFWDVHMLASP